MPILNKFAKAATKPMPSMISPAAHAILDYATAASFFIGAGFFWQRNKRAALAAMVCGGADLALTLLTDYPGGVKRVIAFETHREIDFGLAAMVATMPEFLAFEDEGEKKFFLTQGALITAATGLTQVPEKRGRAEKKKNKKSLFAA
jgi:hypothetical protein